MAQLQIGSDLCGVSRLVGRHYEVVSAIYRVLGAKIGKRVYWPGSGFDVLEYDLIDIGDDVVFGSRSVLMTRSIHRSAPIVIKNNAMLADRCLMLPGSTLSQGSVVGTGGLVSEGSVIPVGSVWVGSKGGQAVNVVPEDNSVKGQKMHSAFGK